MFNRETAKQTIINNVDYTYMCEDAGMTVEYMVNRMQDTVDTGCAEELEFVTQDDYNQLFEQSYS